MTPQARARLRVAALVVVALLVQATVASDLRVRGVAPDLMVLVAVCAGLTGGARQGLLVGFCAGLASDLYAVGTPVGLSALSLCLVGWAVGAVREGLLPESRLLDPVLALVGTAAAVVAFLILGDLVGQSQLAALGRNALIRITVVESLWNAVLALPVCRLYRRAARGSLGTAAVEGRRDIVV